MRISILFLFFVLVAGKAAGQIHPGFDKEEAIDLTAICNSFTFIDLYQSDDEILPSGYEKVYTSGVFGLDNKYQIYRYKKSAVISLRGSTDKKISWMGNIYSTMIPARGTIKVQGKTFDYLFSYDTAATVHSGYALALAYLTDDLLYHIKSLNKENIFDIYITGHSQGGALANLLSSFLNLLEHEKLDPRNRIKTYSFAAPMVGNTAFVEDYNNRLCMPGFSYNVVNPADPIPQFPISYKEEGFLEETITSLIKDRSSVNRKKVVQDAMTILFSEQITGLTKSLSRSVEEQIAKDLGPVKMPPYAEDVNYQKIGNRIEIPPVNYPKIKVEHASAEAGEPVYAKEPWGYQHKPYNYYVSMLKAYAPKRFEKLDKKYLKENL